MDSFQVALRPGEADLDHTSSIGLHYSELAKKLLVARYSSQQSRNIFHCSLFKKSRGRASASLTNDMLCWCSLFPHPSVGRLSEFVRFVSDSLFLTSALLLTLSSFRSTIMIHNTLSARHTHFQPAPSGCRSRGQQGNSDQQSVLHLPLKKSKK